MKIIDSHDLPAGKKYHVVCDCGNFFHHQEPQDSPFCKCPFCDRSVSLMELLENLEKAYS